MNAVKLNLSPYVFNNKGINSFGNASFIGWNELFDIEKCYVKDDAIRLNITIEVVDPDDPNKSILTFERIYQSCAEICRSIFQIKISNINNLMAVRSPKFINDVLPWDLTVLNDTSLKNLDVRLVKNNESSKKMNVSIKLVSANEQINYNKKFEGIVFQPSENRTYKTLLSWDELIKPENGFVNDNSITIQVEVTSDNMARDAQSLKSEIKPEVAEMECTICLESMKNRSTSSVPCGHLFGSVSFM